MLQSLINISLKKIGGKKRHGVIRKRRENKKKRKKMMMKKVREKMRMRIKIAHDLTKFFYAPIREKSVLRSIIKFAYPSIHHITTHMHILI